MTRRHALGGVLWTVTQRWAVRVTTLVVFVILGRLLEPRDFGVVALAGVFVGFLNVLSDLGLSSYLVQARTIDQRVTSTVFWCGLVLSTMMAGLLVAVAPVIAESFDSPELGKILAVLALGIIIAAFSATPSALLKRDLEFRTIAVRSVVATILSAVTAVALAFAGAGAWALVGQALVFSAVSATVLWLASGWRPSPVFDWSLARQSTAYGSSVLGIQLVSQLKRRGADLVIGSVAGTTALGYWTVATRILAVVFDTVVQSISAVSTPLFARLQDDRPRLCRAYNTAVSVSLALITPVLAILLVTAPYAIVLAFGQRWTASVPVAQIMCVSTLISTMLYFDRGLMLAVGRQRTEFVVALTSSAAGLGLIVLAAPYGLRAVALAALIQVAVTWPIRLRLTARTLDMPGGKLALRQGRTVLAGSAAALLAYVASRTLPSGLPDWIMLTTACASVVATYPPTLWLVNRPVVSEVRELLTQRGGPRSTSRASQPPVVESAL